MERKVKGTEKNPSFYHLSLLEDQGMFSQWGKYKCHMWCKSLVSSNGNVIMDCGCGSKAPQMEDEFEHTGMLTIAISRAWFDNHISDFKVC